MIDQLSVSFALTPYRKQRIVIKESSAARKAPADLHKCARTRGGRNWRFRQTRYKRGHWHWRIVKLNDVIVMNFRKQQMLWSATVNRR